MARLRRNALASKCTSFANGYSPLPIDDTAHKNMLAIDFHAGPAIRTPSPGLRSRQPGCRPRQ